MTDVVGPIEAILANVGSLKTLAGEMRQAFGDHQLITNLEALASGIETTIAEIPQAATTVEHVAEGVWDKIVAGFDDLFHPHAAQIVEQTNTALNKVAAAVDAHGAAVADAVNSVLATGAAPIATGPQPPGGAVRQVGGPSSGAPAATQPTPGAVTTTGTAETVDTGKTMTVDGEAQSVHDSPQGPSENITITG